MKKTLTTCFTMVLFSANLLPIVSCAEEQSDTIGQTQSTEEVEQQELKNDINLDSSISEVESEQTAVDRESSKSVLVDTQFETTNEQDAILEEYSSDLNNSIDLSASFFEKNETTEIFITKVGEQARMIGQEKDVYASVMIAQAILESDSGNSQLAQEPNNNLFGIKGDYVGQFVIYGTLEDDGRGNSYTTDAMFRVYPSVKESLEDYSNLLTDGLMNDSFFYQGTWKSSTTSYQEATEALVGTYATDIQYNQKLNELIEMYNLTQYDYEKEPESASGEFEPYNNINYDTTNSYAFGNCTQYVYNRIIQLGGQIDLDMGNGRDWGVVAYSKGYEVTNIPKAGTAVSFNAGVLGADSIYGHVAFLEKVNEDGSILISEMNVEGLNIVSMRTIPAEYVGILTYIVPK